MSDNRATSSPFTGYPQPSTNHTPAHMPDVQAASVAHMSSMYPYPPQPTSGAPAYTRPAPATQTAPTLNPPAPVMPYDATPTPVMQTHSDTSETFLGGKVVGIIAAILLLSGLVLLGATFIPELPDVLKAAFIFLAAIILTAGGAFLVSKSRNAFAYALFASGLLAFFIAIFTSWTHFQLFSHTTALVLSGIWMALTIGLLLYTRTWPLTIALSLAAGLFGISFLEGNWIRGLDTAAQAGYGSLFTPYEIAAFSLLAAYLLALGFVGIHLAIKTLSEDRLNATKVQQKCVASFFVAEGALFYAALDSTWTYSVPFVFVILAVLCLAIQLMPLPTPLHNNQLAWRVNEIVVFCLGAIAIIAAGEPHEIEIPTLVLYGFFTIAAIIVTGIHAIRRTKEGYVRPNAAIPVLVAFGLSMVFTNYLCALALPSASPYVWSAIEMACALVAIGAGFWFGEKPLRLYGLILTLLFVLKIALFDISGDALAHAVALVVAGLICFGISALYTYTNKRLS